MQPIYLFTGYDEREAIGWHVFARSVIWHASRPVALIPLHSNGMPQGTNAFTASRFLVPWLMGFHGHAIFADAADMLCMGDVAQLDALFDPSVAVQVVPHQYQTRNRRKYIGTPMEAANQDYPRKNWASLMIMNCAHPAWRWADPQVVAQCNLGHMLGFEFLRDSEIGYLPAVWNVLADEDQPLQRAQILHWTAGIPAWPHYSQAPGAEHWHQVHRELVQ